VFPDEEGIIHFQIKAYEEESGTLLSFVHYASARETLERWMEAHELCQRYCGLSESTSACFHYQIRKCRGICAGQEDVAVYNQRAIELIRQHTYVHPDFIILDRGRRAGEHAFILILNYAYQGYGYLDEQDRISDVDELKSYLHIRQVHPDDDAIIRSWMKQKNPVIRILKK